MEFFGGYTVYTVKHWLVPLAIVANEGLVRDPLILVVALVTLAGWGIQGIQGLSIHGLSTCPPLPITVTPPEIIRHFLRAYEPLVSLNKAL